MGPGYFAPEHTQRQQRRSDRYWSWNPLNARLGGLEHHGNYPPIQLACRWASCWSHKHLGHSVTESLSSFSGMLIFRLGLLLGYARRQEHQGIYWIAKKILGFVQWHDGCARAKEEWRIWGQAEQQDQVCVGRPWMQSLL
jgi:hypothetical protein